MFEDLFDGPQVRQFVLSHIFKFKELLESDRLAQGDVDETNLLAGSVLNFVQRLVLKYRREETEAQTATVFYSSWGQL